MTNNQTRIELIAEGSYVKVITRFQCRICEKIFNSTREVIDHQFNHTELEFIQKL